jgi:hypothetical protein
VIGIAIAAPKAAEVLAREERGLRERRADMNGVAKCGHQEDKDTNDSDIRGGKPSRAGD